MIKEKIKSLLSNLFFWQTDKSKVYVFIDKRQLPLYPDYLERCEFYFKNSFELVPYSSAFQFYRSLFLKGPIRILFSSKFVNEKIVKLYFGNVDYLANHMDGWIWHQTLYKLHPLSESEMIQSKERFNKYHLTLPKFEGCLVLGTGPSLAKSKMLVNEPLYKVVCNTIVRDHILWANLKPHYIVAGDAIYHFGHNKYASSFREDLKKCLRIHPVLFLYPDQYHPYVKEEFKDYLDFLVPIPEGTSSNINNNLFTNFNLPALGNVLNLLLLPLATSISKTVYLLGFDGRAPDDKLFWSNSNSHSYGEYIPDIQIKHPRFFDYFVDNKNPFKYVNNVHGDILDTNLNELENEGYKFISLAPSHTNTIHKRYKNEFNL